MTEKNKKYILPVSLSIVFLVIGFGLGTFYQKNHLRSNFSTRMGQFQTGEALGNRTNTGRNNSTGQGNGNSVGLRDGSGNNSVFGEISNVDDSSITVKTSDGNSKIILLSDSTTINQSTTASKDDLKVGTQIKVDGTTDTNTGSITGKSIEINPSMPNQLSSQQ